RAIDRIGSRVVTSCRGLAGRDGNDVRRKETFEAGNVAALGCGDEGVEKTSLLGRTRGPPSATSDVLPSATHYLPRVWFFKSEDLGYITVRIVERLSKDVRSSFRGRQPFQQ